MSARIVRGVGPVAGESGHPERCPVEQDLSAAFLGPGLLRASAPPPGDVNFSGADVFPRAGQVGSRDHFLHIRLFYFA